MVIKCKRIKRVKTFISHLMKMKTVHQHQQKTTVPVPPKKRTLLTLSSVRPSALSGQTDRDRKWKQVPSWLVLVLVGLSVRYTALLSSRRHYQEVVGRPVASHLLFFSFTSILRGSDKICSGVRRILVSLTRFVGNPLIIGLDSRSI